MLRLKLRVSDRPEIHHSGFINEFLVGKNTKERVEILGIVIGLGLPLGSHNPVVKDYNAVCQEFDIKFRIEIINLLNKLKEGNLIFPNEPILNIARSVYACRLSMDKYSLAQIFVTFTHLTKEGLLGTFINYKNTEHVTDDSLVNWLHVLNFTVWDLIDREVDIFDTNTFLKELDKSIDRISAEPSVSPDFSVDVPLPLWRKAITTARDSLVNLKNGQFDYIDEDYTLLLVIFLVDALSRQNQSDTIAVIAYSKVFVEAVSKLQLYDHYDNAEIQIGCEDLNVAGDEELVFFSDGVEGVLEERKLDNLARTMVNTIKEFKSDTNEMKELLANEEYVGMEDHKEVVQKILALLMTHINKLVPAFAILILGIIAYLLNREKAEPIASKAQKAYDDKVAVIEKKYSHPPSMASLGVNTTESTKSLSAMIAMYGTDLDVYILSGNPKYKVSALQDTLTAHVEASHEIIKDLNLMVDEYKSICQQVMSPDSITPIISKIEELYIKDDFHLLPYTLSPLYDFVKKAGGQTPASSPAYESATKVVNFSSGPGDAFWRGRAHYNTDKPALSIGATLRPYSGLNGKGTQRHGILEDIKRMGSFNISKLDKEKASVESNKTAVERIVRDLQSVSTTLHRTIPEEVRNLTVWPLPPDGARIKANEYLWKNIAKSRGILRAHGLGNLPIFDTADIVSELITGNTMVSKLHAITAVSHSVLDLWEVFKRITQIKKTYERHYNILRSEQEAYQKALDKYYADGGA